MSPVLRLGTWLVGTLGTETGREPGTIEGFGAISALGATEGFGAISAPRATEGFGTISASGTQEDQNYRKSRITGN